MAIKKGDILISKKNNSSLTKEIEYIAQSDVYKDNDGNSFIDVYSDVGEIISRDITSFRKKSKGGNNIMEKIKGWFNKNSDTVIWVVVLFAIDEFVFEGKFRSKLTNMFDKLVSKTEKRITGGK